MSAATSAVSHQNNPLLQSTGNSRQISSRVRHSWPGRYRRWLDDGREDLGRRRRGFDGLLGLLGLDGFDGWLGLDALGFEVLGFELLAPLFEPPDADALLIVSIVGVAYAMDARPRSLSSDLRSVIGQSPIKLAAPIIILDEGPHSPSGCLIDAGCSHAA